VEKYSTDIKASSMLMLGGKTDQTQKVEPKHDPLPAADIDSDDIPF